MTETPRNEEGALRRDPTASDATSEVPTAGQPAVQEGPQEPHGTSRRDGGPATGADPLRSSLTGRAWVSVVALGVVLVLLIIFIAQNTRSVTVSFLGWEGRTPLAVALLIATAAGLFLAAVAGTLRIWQLRRRVKRENKRRR